MAEITQSTSGNNVGVARRRARSPIKIDMTPMVDLAFLLLTFFVLTTTLHKSYVMPLSMPEPPSPAPVMPVSANRVVTFLLEGHDKIYWYQGVAGAAMEETTFSKNGLHTVLAAKKEQIKKLVVLVKASDRSKYKNIVDILDELAIANIEHYSMVDITAEDETFIKRYAANKK